MIFQNQQWIAVIDHRISSAVIFYFLLILMDNGHRKPMFWQRSLLALLTTSVVSWCIRYLIELPGVSLVLQGIGYSLHLLAWGGLFLLFYRFCYNAGLTETIYVDMLAIIIYKLSWNVHKMLSNAWFTIQAPEFWEWYSPIGSLVSYLVYGLVCWTCCTVHRRVVVQPPTEVSRRGVLRSAGAFVVCLMVLEYCGHVFSLSSNASFLYYLSMVMYTLLNYVVLVTIAQLVYYRNSNEDMQHFIDNKIQYYEMSRDGITSLQIKCHDLKHQIAAIRSQVDKANFEKTLSRLEDSIIEYGTVIECGNEAINVVLTEKNILCMTQGVKFSYMIDGTLFDFMTDMELYSLFGNALDNALESCNRVKDSGKRVISLKANTRGSMVVMHVENYYEDALNIVDGLPVTTKCGSGHGFGLRSIQQIAEKYNGFLSVQTENNIFQLTVLLTPSK